jgi:hypothetical protein
MDSQVDSNSRTSIFWVAPPAAILIRSAIMQFTFGEDPDAAELDEQMFAFKYERSYNSR